MWTSIVADFWRDVPKSRKVPGSISMPRVGKKSGAREREKRKKREKEGKERERKGERKINFLSPDASLPSAGSLI
jgi:hypothetical protein